MALDRRKLTVCVTDHGRFAGADSLRMKILQICSAREIGGGEKHLADLANSLSGKGHEVYAAVIPASPLIRELLLPDGQVLELPMRNSLNFSSAFRLARFVRQHRLELIHAHVARDYPLAALAASRAGVPLVLTRHVLFPMRRIHRLTLRRVSRVIAVSGAVAEGLRRQALFDDQKIVVIPNGVDLDRFTRTNERAPGNLRVGTIGHLAPIKGLEEFVRAAATVLSGHEDVEFVIAGEDKSRDGFNRHSLERLIGELGIGRQVRLLGWTDDVAGFLSMLDLYVSAARSEPFGLTIVEAMAAGVPVVATRSEGACEIIEDGHTGRLVPVQDVASLAKAINDLLIDTNERARLSVNARQAVRERFSLEPMVNATEQLYRQVLSDA